MAKIILNDGTEEYLKPGEASAKVSAGLARYAEGVPMYSTRQLVAEPVKVRKKRKPKPLEQPEPEPEPAPAQETEPEPEPVKGESGDPDGLE